MAALEKSDLGDATQATFNAAVNAQFEGTSDYIVTHYKTNTRSDTDYWRANAANTHLSEPLTRLLKTWLSSLPSLKNHSFGQGYPIMSWYSLLAGMGLFPDPQELRPPTLDEAQHNLAAIDNLLDRSAQNFPDHHALLQAIPLKPKEESLQLYLW